MKHRRYIALILLSGAAIAFSLVLLVTGASNWLGLVAVATVAAFALLLAPPLLSVRHTLVLVHRKLEALPARLTANQEELESRREKHLSSFSARLKRNYEENTARSLRHYDARNRDSLKAATNQLKIISSHAEDIRDSMHKLDAIAPDASKDNFSARSRPDLLETRLHIAYGLWVNWGGQWNSLPFDCFADLAQLIVNLQPQTVSWENADLRDSLASSGAIAYLSQAIPEFPKDITAATDERYSPHDPRSTGSSLHLTVQLKCDLDSVMETLDTATVPERDPGRSAFFAALRDNDESITVSEYARARGWQTAITAAGYISALR